MRISDWSSDVCSSDLLPFHAPSWWRMEPELNRHGSGHQCRSSAAAVVAVAIAAVGGDGTAGGFTAQAGCVMLGDYPRHRGGDLQIGRASCRERVCQYV